MPNTKITHTCVAAIVGRPNVGKSTLANYIAGEKVAIVSNKPQTTRNRIFAVCSKDDTQYVFVDTPGYHQPRNLLGEYMTETVRRSFDGADVVLLVVSAEQTSEMNQAVLTLVRNSNVPAVLAINKLDLLAGKAETLPLIADYSQLANFTHIVPISAKKGDGVPELLTALSGFAQEGAPLFPEGMTTDQPDSVIVAELLREKLLYCLDKEIPHGTAIEVTKFQERETAAGEAAGIIDLEATIYCEKESHKRIIIGKGGSMLKKVGAQARTDIERYMGCKVFLQTWVKVKENWRDRASLVRSFGYVQDD
ncbi:MAG: GTPase Era [Oscillospiraceae bacterium]|jgi:GTP-binding protein Era|nr:GTPase Era [Oscillospiraceae bacterium]